MLVNTHDVMCFPPVGNVITRCLLLLVNLQVKICQKLFGDPTLCNLVCFWMLAGCYPFGHGC